MKSLPDFPLVRPGKLSSWFAHRRIKQFSEAVVYVRTLFYRRTNGSSNLSVLEDSAGSFTARNALLVQLAQEQGYQSLHLALCVHSFDRNYPGAGVGGILEENGLSTLPNVQGCIKHRGQMYTVATDSLALEAELLSAIEIAPVQIGTFKRRYHQNYLRNWIQIERLEPDWSVEALWEVRSQCLCGVAEQWNNYVRSAL
ncbi:MAG: hypothetical protein WA958_07560 [Tunicatimonas sp.]